MHWIGTSGYQYPEWRGSFYPEKFPTAKMLGFYAEQFPTVEINYTFNTLPTESVLARWSEQTPGNFKFTLKAPKRVTHVRTPDRELLGTFIERSRLLQRKLGVLLFQFPPHLKKNFEWLDVIIGGLPDGTRAAFEFRHPSWFDDELYQRLRVRNLALCIAETEDLKTPLVATADYGYFRLRLESYTPAGIKRWAGEIRSMKRLKDVFVYFMHEETGSGPVYARKLMKLLSESSDRAAES